MVQKNGRLKEEIFVNKTVSMKVEQNNYPLSSSSRLSPYNVVNCTFDCTLNDVFKLGNVFVKSVIKSSINVSNSSPHDVIELSKSICRDMMMMVWHDMIDVLGVGMLDNRSSGISSTIIR
jgi:hypothetical protein